MQLRRGGGGLPSRRVRTGGGGTGPVQCDLVSFFLHK